MTTTFRQKLTSLAFTGFIVFGCAGVATSAAIVDTVTNPSIAQADQWQYSNGGWWLQTNNGYATGWKQINGTWYLFDHNGWMKTGWQKIGGKWYYFNDDGAMKTGWVTEPWWKSWYYLDNSGAMVTGWNRIGSKWYYFNKSGEMLIGWQCINGKWYHLNGSGAMDVNKWIGNYYVKSDGSMAINQKVGKYYVGADGLWNDAVTNTDPLHISTDFYEFNLPKNWKDKVSYKNSDNKLTVNLRSNNNIELFTIYVEPTDHLEHMNAGVRWSLLHIGKTPSGANVYIHLGNTVEQAAWQNIYGTSDTYYDDNTFIDLIYLTTGNKVTYDQICQNPKLYEFDTTVANYFNQTIIPTFKLHN